MNAQHREEIEYHVVSGLVGLMDEANTSPDRVPRLVHATAIGLPKMITHDALRTVSDAALHCWHHDIPVTGHEVMRHIREAFVEKPEIRDAAIGALMRAGNMEAASWERQIDALRLANVHAMVLKTANELQRAAQAGYGWEALTQTTQGLMGQLIQHSDLGRGLHASVGASDALDAYREQVHQEIAASSAPASAEGAAFRRRLTTPTAGLAEDWFDVCRRGSLFVLGARPGVGKSAWALGWAYLLAAQGLRVTFLTLEMRAVEKAQRLSRLETPYGIRNVLNRPALLPDVEQAIARAQHKAGDRLRFFRPKRGMTCEQFRPWWRQECRQNGKPDMLVIDHLHRWDYHDMPRLEERRQIAALTSMLKDTADESDTLVCALAQLNRSADLSERPELRHLYGSKAIEQDADLVGFLHRPDMEKPGFTEAPEPCELVTRKNRNGPMGIYQMAFWRQRFTFGDMTT